MDKDNIFSGETLKTIRENKRYTQKEIANHTMSRSHYSKMEKDEVNPNILKYFAILDYLDINHDEFTFILNDYELDPKELVLYKFKELKQVPHISAIEELIQLSEKLLDNREDHITRDIYNIALGYYSLIEDKDLKRANTYAGNVWDRLRELDKFYLSEHHLLSKILYFFKLETAVSLTENALEELEKYYPFHEVGKLMNAYLFSITSLLLAHKEYKMALEYSERLIKKTKEEGDLISIGTAFTSKGVCLDHLGENQEAHKWYEKAKGLFDSIDRKDLVTCVKEAPQMLFNPYAYVEIESLKEV